jgi:hypothetical protein
LPVELFDHVFAFLFIAFKPLAEEIGKQEKPEDGKEDEEFDEDNQPEGFPHGHTAETFIVEAEYFNQPGHALMASKNS